MFQLFADKTKLILRQRETVTSGSVNAYLVQFQFSDDWEGLERTAVFRAGGESRSVLLDASGACGIPWEVLQTPLGPLEAGVYGTRDGGTVLPTVWCSLGTILPGAAPGEDAQPPAPDVYQQILAQTSQDRHEAAEASAAAAQAAERAENAALHPPRPSEDGTWLVWDAGQGGYTDTGLPATGPQGKQGEQGPRGFPGTEVVIHETYGPMAAAAVDMAVPGTPLRPVSEIRPVQEGGGTASPDNVRNIPGWTGVTLARNGEDFVRSFPETVYSGSYDWAAGELTVTEICFRLAVADMDNTDTFPGWKNLAGLEACFPADFNNGSVTALLNIGNKAGVNRSGSNNVVYLPRYFYSMTQSEWKASYPDLTVQAVFPLLEPRVIRLTPQEILALSGDNVLTSSTGSTTVTFQAELKQYIDRKIQAAAAGL